MTGTSSAVQAACRTSARRPYRPAGRKAKYGRFSVLPRPEIYRNLRIKDSVKIDRPKHWGLRGDKYFWADLESRFAFVEVGSINEDEFVQAIHNLYLAKTGQELNADHNAYVKEYAHGGMSSGQVCGNWWVNEGIPMLVERFNYLK